MKINKLIKPINEGYVVKSKKKSLSERYYTCPECHNRTLAEVPANDDIYICDECGASGRGYETFEGNIVFYDDVDESKNQNDPKQVEEKVKNLVAIYGEVRAVEKIIDGYFRDEDENAPEYLLSIYDSYNFGYVPEDKLDVLYDDVSDYVASRIDVLSDTVPAEVLNPFLDAPYTDMEESASESKSIKEATSNPTELFSAFRNDLEGIGFKMYPDGPTVRFKLQEQPEHSLYTGVYLKAKKAGYREVKVVRDNAERITYMKSKALGSLNIIETLANNSSNIIIVAIMNKNVTLDESKSIKEDKYDYGISFEYCPSCGEYCDIDDADDCGKFVRFNCTKCGNSFDRTLPTKSIKESAPDRNEDIVTALEKTPYTSFVVDEGEYIKIQGKWRTTSRRAHSDYIEIKSFLNKKLGAGNFDLVYEGNDTRDDGKEVSCSLRLELKNSLKEESKSWGGHKHPEQDKIEKALMAINGTTKVEFDYRPNDGVYKVPENHLIILPFCRDDKVFGDGSEYFKNRKKWKDSVLAKLRQLGWTQEDPMEDNDTYLYLVMKKRPKMNETSSLYQKNKDGSIYKMTPEVTKVLQEISRLYKFFDYKKDVAKVKFRSDVIRQLQIFCKWYLEEANSTKPDTRELKNFAIQIANIVRTRNVVNESKTVKTLGAGGKKLNETTYSMEDNMGDWKQICRAYCRKIGAELLFVNETSFGYEDKNGQMVHMYVDELMDALGLGESLNDATRPPQEPLDEDSNRYRDPDNGKVMLDRWYAAKYPDDEVGIDQLDGLYMDDALKDRSILGHCDTQVRDRVYQQLDRYIPLSVDSPMYKETVTESMSGFVQTNCANCGKKNKVEVHFPEYNKGFETTTYTCNHCGEQNELSDPHQYNDDGTINEAVDYKVKFFQVFETPKSPKENGKMIGQRGTLDDANAFGKEKVGEGNYIIKAVCDDGQTRPIDNDTKSDAFKMVNEDTVVPSSYEFDDDVDDLTYYYDDELFKDNLENSPYTEVASKQVMDSDGFMTDYTMYMNINTGEYVFVFGDKDVYSPDDGYFDWECETEAEARAWFDNYTGFSDDLDDMDESLDLTKDEIELLLMGQDMGSWYDEILDNEEILNRYYDAENKAKKIATAKNMDFADYLDTLQINEEVSGNSDDDNSSQTKPSPVKSTDKNQEESPIVAKKSDGSYLIPASNGDGYVAFNRSDVCMGNISAANENEAKGKFNANKFDESINEKLDGSGWWSVEWDLTLEGEEISFDDLSESTQEHIADSILDGYLQGEIAEWNEDEETEDYGWWVARFDISVEDNDRVRFEDLSETSQEQISNAIKDGYVSGELFE